MIIMWNKVIFHTWEKRKIIVISFIIIDNKNNIYNNSNINYDKSNSSSSSSRVKVVVRWIKCICVLDREHKAERWKRCSLVAPRESRFASSLPSLHHSYLSIIAVRFIPKHSRRIYIYVCVDIFTLTRACEHAVSLRTTTCCDV